MDPTGLTIIQVTSGFRQDDTPHNNVKLGNGNYTIGEKGCIYTATVNAIASAITYYNQLSLSKYFETSRNPILSFFSKMPKLKNPVDRLTKFNLPGYFYDDSSELPIRKQRGKSGTGMVGMFNSQGFKVAFYNLDYPDLTSLFDKIMQLEESGDNFVLIGQFKSLNDETGQAKHYVNINSIIDVDIENGVLKGFNLQVFETYGGYEQPVKRVYSAEDLQQLRYFKVEKNEK